MQLHLIVLNMLQMRKARAKIYIRRTLPTASHQPRTAGQPALRPLIASPEKALVDKAWTDRRFSGTRLSDFEPYLLDDLRLDAPRLADLDARRLASIANACDSPKIHRLVRCLQKLEKKRHA